MDACSVTYMCEQKHSPQSEMHLYGRNSTVTTSLSCIQCRQVVTQGEDLSASNMHFSVGDVICTTSDIQPHESALPDLQCFWEAFPSGSGPSDRTTYMFTYVDALPQRPSLQTMMEEYWKLMPGYQVCTQQSLPLDLAEQVFAMLIGADSSCSVFRSSQTVLRYQKLWQISW